MKIPIMFGGSSAAGRMTRKSSNVVIVPKNGNPRLSYVKGKNK
jgi:hypothetical protein